MYKLQNKIVFINKRRTSMRLSKNEWDAIEEVCSIEKSSKNHLLSLIENNKPKNFGLTCATRVFLLNYFREASTQTGHSISGHGCICKNCKIKI